MQRLTVGFIVLCILALALLVVPLATRAQPPAPPVVGFLNTQSPGLFAHLVAGFRQGLSDAGYVEGQNVAIAYRWAENHYERLPALAANLAIDKHALSEAVGLGLDRPTGSIIPRALDFALPLEPFAYERAQARRLPRPAIRRGLTPAT